MKRNIFFHENNLPKVRSTLVLSLLEQAFSMRIEIKKGANTPPIYSVINCLILTLEVADVQTPK